MVTTSSRRFRKPFAGLRVLAGVSDGGDPNIMGIRTNS
jgi:hypothetical protein